MTVENSSNAFSVSIVPFVALPLWPIVVAPHWATLEGTRYTHTGVVREAFTGKTANEVGE